ncbi:MAG TPA: NAD(P)H-dependent oxidoreductase [Kofleriaceae bacterium]|nr:NAD(P)H-dependent oxidoreductase [Kofleriaceae bacterium]
MTNILQLNSSVKGASGRSTVLGEELARRLLEQHPGARLIVRDLVAQPVPHLDPAALGALSTAAGERSAAQQAVVATLDALIAEIQSADVIVLGAPMYNFTIPIQLKAYFDAIARAGVTFRYTAAGPEGLLRGKRVYVILTRGGVHRGKASDSQTPFLAAMLGFLGLTDVEYVYAEGLDMGPAAQAVGLAAARQAIADLVADGPALRGAA